jgi:hypothetical protein
LTIEKCGNFRPREIGKLGALKQLTLCMLNELQEMPDLTGLTALCSLTIECCGKLRALPRRIGELGSIRSSHFRG